MTDLERLRSMYESAGIGYSLITNKTSISADYYIYAMEDQDCGFVFIFDRNGKLKETANYL